MPLNHIDKVMLNEKDYCDYETCVALKEIGYNEKSNWWFSKFFNEDSGQMELLHISDNPAHLNYDSWGVVPKDFIIRPSLYETQKWLREEKGILLQPTYLELSDEWICVIRDKNKRHGHSTQKQKNYEEALLEGVREAIKLLKEERK